MGLLKQSTARNLAFLMVDSTDHLTGKTGLAPAVTLSKDAAAFAAAGGAVTEISSGWYKIALTTTDTNTLGDLALHCTSAGADATDFKEQVVAFDPTDAAGLGLSRLDVAVSTRATSAGAGGAGSRQVTITVNKPDTVSPLGSCAVWVSTDLAGANVVAGTLYTNDSTGQVTFMLDNGTYYYWRQHPQYTFTNPVAITVS